MQLRPRLPRIAPKRIRLPRVERSEPTEIVGDDSQSWAVSYADLLLVMLSFFVVFFSLEKNSGSVGIQTSLLKSLAINLGAKSPDSERSNSSESSEPLLAEQDGALSPDASLRSFHKMSSMLQEAGVSASTAPESERLVIRFPDSVYRPRQFEPPSEIKQQLKKLSEIAGPDIDKFRITFIGHTDSTPVTAVDSILTDNQILGALRASKALDHMRTLGLSDRLLFIGSEHSATRNTRSLSLISVHPDLRSA